MDRPHMGDRPGSMGVSSDVAGMVAPDSTDLVSTPESYIESEAYAMPVSRHELFGLVPPMG
jgi:hypothetical protein